MAPSCVSINSKLACDAHCKPLGVCSCLQHLLICNMCSGAAPCPALGLQYLLPLLAAGELYNTGGHMPLRMGIVQRMHTQ